MLDSIVRNVSITRTIWKRKFLPPENIVYRYLFADRTYQYKLFTRCDSEHVIYQIAVHVHAKVECETILKLHHIRVYFNITFEIKNQIFRISIILKKCYCTHVPCGNDAISEWSMTPRIYKSTTMEWSLQSSRGLLDLYPSFRLRKWLHIGQVEYFHF